MNTPPDSEIGLLLRECGLRQVAADRQKELRHLAARLLAGKADTKTLRAAALALLQLSGQDELAEVL